MEVTMTARPEPTVERALGHGAPARADEGRDRSVHPARGAVGAACCGHQV